MQEIRCPKCGEVFQVDDSGYDQIAQQVRDREFEKELDRRKKDLDAKREQELEIIRLQEEKEHTASITQKDAEISEKDQKIAELQAKLDASETAKKLAVAEAVEQKNVELSQKVTEIANLKGELKSKDTESRLNEKSLQEQYEEKLKLKDEQIEYYKDFKARQSTKMIGESLEQHCLTQFNTIRMTAFPNAYFEKDNDAKTGSKGDFIYRECGEDGTEFISIMFEMKNEADETATKHKNEDFFKELDKDRNEKGCEYAILVSLLEIDNDYFLPVTAGDIFTNSKDEWFVLIGQDCDMARSITRTPKNALAELLPAKVRPQTDFEKWTNDLRTASIYSFRKSLDAGCDVLQVEYQKRQYIANEILNLCSFNSTGECKISLSDSIGQEQLMLMPDYMVEYYSNLQRFFLATKTLRMQAEDAFEIVLSKEHSPRLLSFKDFDKTSNTVSFDLKRVCRLTHDYVFYLYKLYLEYRGRQPFQTINLIRQEDTSLPVMYNKKETGQYLSFRSVPIPDKSNRKNWCWVIDAVELNRVLMLLELPTRSGNDDIVLKDESVELRLEQNKKIRIVKAKEKVRFEAV